MALQAHPLADLFPLLEGDEFLAFAEDIRMHGVRERIELLNGEILDGRNRYNALVHLTETGEVLGEGWGHRSGEPLAREHLDPEHAWFHKFNVYVDGDPLPWVLSKNLRRRHLDESQRAMVAAKLANMGVGRPATPEFDPAPDHIPPIGGISAQASAAMLNVGTRSVERARTVLRDGISDLQHAVEQGQVAVSVAEKIARLPEAEQPETLAKAMPNGARTIMAARNEPDDSLDYFPTPPWATRALIERVFRDCRLPAIRSTSVWEPACGEGHMAEVLLEYGCDVLATDVFDYGYGSATADFLKSSEFGNRDWIITNPPFGEKSEAFVLRALDEAKIGVAMFVRLQWLETNGRYERIFQKYPPTLISFFAERVNLCKARWEPEGSTATAYIWLVWAKDASPRAPYWIAPGCRAALSKPDDAERFTSHPVTKIDHPKLPSEQPATAPIDSAALELPTFLKRNPDNTLIGDPHAPHH